MALALCACGGQGEAGDGPPTPAEAFLAQNAKAAGVTVLPSGLQYKVVKSGPADGVRPRMGDDVKVHYEGALTDGTVFDSSYERGMPATFVVGQLVPGFDEALQLMKPGDVWYLYIPPDLGYGDREAGQIPPGSVLVFKLEMLGVLPRQGPSSLG